jgi:hypothetical protein
MAIVATMIAATRNRIGSMFVEAALAGTAGAGDGEGMGDGDSVGAGIGIWVGSGVAGIGMGVGVGAVLGIELLNWLVAGDCVSAGASIPVDVAVEGIGVYAVRGVGVARAGVFCGLLDGSDAVDGMAVGGGVVAGVV